MSDASITNTNFTLKTLTLTDSLVFPNGSTQTIAYSDVPASTSTYVINTLTGNNGVIATLSTPMTLINVFGTGASTFNFTNSLIPQANLYLIFNTTFTGSLTLLIVDVSNNSPTCTTNNIIFIINNVSNTLYYGFTVFNVLGQLSFYFPNITINDTDGMTLYISTFQYI